jgi:hypothetical protein
METAKTFIKNLFQKYKISYDVIDFIWKTGIFDVTTKEKSQQIMGIIIQYMSEHNKCSDEQLKIVILAIQIFREMFRNETKQFERKP